MDNQKIGNYIKKKRKEKGLTQQELGDLVGVGFKAVSKWECGNSIPDVSILKKVGDILDISTDELLEGRDKKNFYKNRKKIYFIISFIAIILLIILFYIILFKNNIKENDNEYNCTLIKTYNVNNISSSNDNNYLYVTFSEYQTEGVYTIKLPKTLSKDLVIGKNYEFTFNTNKKYIFKTLNEIFDNSELINIEQTDSVGLEQENKYNCK